MRNLKRNVDEIYLNLTPMMDLFVGLIPFLILSATFVSLGGIETQAPSASSTAAVPHSKNSDELWLTFEIGSDKVIVAAFKKDYVQEIPSVKGEFALADLPRMTKFLDDLSVKSYKIGPSLFHAKPDIKYENAVSVLNAMKSSKAITDIVMASGVVE